MPGLTNLFVEKTMQEISNHPEKFKGVMACDVFLSYMKNSTKLSPKDCFIINLSSSDHRGSHFICIFLDTSTSAEYFDSFGIESFDGLIKIVFTPSAPAKWAVLLLTVKNKSRFSLDAMTKKLGEILDDNVPEFPKEVKLELPKLKKVGEPKNKKMKLPKLKKV